MHVISENEKNLHHELAYVGLRAQATAGGVLQLTIELQRAKLLEADAVTRIKTAICNEIALHAPRSITPETYRKDIEARLDRLFSGQERIGPASDLAIGEEGRN